MRVCAVLCCDIEYKWCGAVQCGAVCVAWCGVCGMVCALCVCLFVCVHSFKRAYLGFCL